MADDLLFTFPSKNQHPQFAQGFACGRVWELLVNGGDMDGVVPEACRDTIEAMAMHFGLVEEITPRSPGWIHVRIRNAAVHA